MNQNGQIDKHTFGGSKAAETLVKILETSGNKYCIHRISRFFHKHCRILKIIDEIGDKSASSALRTLWRDHTHAVIQNAEWPEEAKSYLSNIVATKFKQKK